MSEKRLSRSILVALLLCNVVVYGQTVSFEFLSWDDQQYVVKNLERFGGRLDAASVRWSITNQEHGWRTPISHLSLFLDAQVYGVKSWGMHLTNSLIHSCSTVLLFFVMRKMTGKAIASGIAAAIFAVHPLHVEPVAWVTGRWDLLCGFFWIAGMGAYVNHLQRKTLSSYLCLLILFLFALWSKPTALTFPFCLLLLDLWPLNRIRFSTSAEPDRDDSKLDCLVSPGRAILEKAPLFGIMGVELYLSAQAKSAYVMGYQPIEFTLAERLGNAALSYVHYVRDFLVPHDLSFYYRHPVTVGGMDWTLVAGALTLVVIVSVAAVFALRSSKVWFVGWFWFLGTLVPSIGLLQVHLHGRADRYMYIPLIGLAFLVAFAAPEVLLRILPSGRVSRRCLLGGASAFVLVGCGLSFRQARVWRTSEALYVNALRIDPENYLVLEHLGVLRMRTGDFEQASECFRRAAETVPFKHAPYLMLTARSLAQEGKYSEAYRWHREAIAMAPKNIMARYVFVRTLLQSDRLNEAVEQIEEAAKLPAANADFYQLLGEEMTREGHDSLAIRYFEKSLALEPDRKPVPTLLGSVLARARSQHEAVRFYREYLQEYPNRADVANELAWTLATSVHDDLRDGIEAIAIAEELCQEYEDLSPAVLDTLAAAYAEEGRFDDAVSAAGRALELAKRVGSNEHIRGLEAGVEQYRQKSPHRDRIAEGVLPSGEEQQP